MNFRRILSYLLVAAVAGTGGYFLAPRLEKPAPVVKQLKPVRKEPVPPSTPPVAGLIPAGIARIIGSEPVTVKNANSLMYRALEEANPVSRMAAVGLLLESMTKETGPELYQAFLDITTRSGRRLDGEWGMMLRRYGEVMGADCFQKLLPEHQNLAIAIEGWAAVDPEGVQKALEDARVRDTRFDNAYLTGICRVDPEKALNLALTVDYPALDAGALIAQAINTSGLEEARKALQTVLTEVPESAGSQNFQGMFNSLAEAMLHKSWTEGTPDKMLGWLEEQKGQPYLSPAVLNRSVHDALLKGDANATVEWLTRMSDGAAGEVPGAKGVLEAAFEKPEMLTSLSDEAFNKLLPMLPASAAGSFRALSVMIAATNPERAEQLRAAAPPAPPTPPTQQ